MKKKKKNKKRFSELPLVLGSLLTTAFIVLVGLGIYGAVSEARPARIKQGECFVWHKHLLWAKTVKDDSTEAVLFDWTDAPEIVYVVPRGEVVFSVICPTKEIR